MSWEAKEAQRALERARVKLHTCPRCRADLQPVALFEDSWGCAHCHETWYVPKEGEAMSKTTDRKLTDQGEYRTMTTHTPGPWVIVQPKDRMETKIRFNGSNPTSLDGRDIASVFECPAQANARLIAAAPELLAALQAIVRITDGSQPKDYPGAVMIARAAIATATGQES